VTPLSEAEKTDARRFCGYPVFAAVAVGLLDWRAYQMYGLMEFRLNNLSDAEVAILRRYLVTLAGLEQAVPRAGDAMDTDQAAVWTRNKDESRDRVRLLDDWRRRLCGFLGLPPGRGLMTGNIALVV
jgi:hypothetical protein